MYFRVTGKIMRPYRGLMTTTGSKQNQTQMVMEETETDTGRDRKTSLGSSHVRFIVTLEYEMTLFLLNVHQGIELSDTLRFLIF